jgi:hypothetical protein
MARKRFNHGPFGNKHNDLFRPGPNMQLNACVGKNGGRAGFDRYACGYFAAGARLLKSLHDDSSDVDLLVYPLVMIYRHGVEVALKHLARLLAPLCEEKGEPQLTHKLLDNWQKVRRYLAKLEADSDDLKRIDAILNDLIEIDWNGETFRFPEDKKGTPLLQDTSLINVEVFCESMDYVARFFEGCCYWADHLYECRHDALQAEAEAYGEMADYYS